jgi:hypothetical protein
MRKVGFLLMIILMLVGPGRAGAELVGHWPLDGDGTDISGKGHDGTVNGNVVPTTDRFGNPSGAMYFPGGGGDNVDVGNPTDFQMTGAMTITGWAYLDSTSPVHGDRNGRVVGKMGGGGSRSWSTGIEKNINSVPLTATLQVSPDGGSVISYHDNFQVSFPLDEWVHYAGVYTPGVSMEVFLNGESLGVKTTDVPASQYGSNGQPALIGNRPSCGDCGWYGALDDVRIYNEALTQQQIKAIMVGVAASNPDPANGADRVPLDKVLSWDAPDPCNLEQPPAQYIVYFDPNETLVRNGDASVSFGQQAGTQFDPPGDMELFTTYYWRIDVVDPNFGVPQIYPGAVWTFTTIAPKAGLISPDNGAVDVPRNALLEWDAGFGAIEHIVYFGTDQTLVENGDDSVKVATQTETTFDPDLDWQTDYFWRIDEVFSVGQPEPGDVWSFTTGSPVCEEPLVGDVNDNCIIDIDDVALMGANWLICNVTNDDCP